ncbi:acyl-CoA dehydrogenase [Candidatus Marinamargulisbacteria bacterium SCGC AG-410-N11]|nr:acyl-CoA dehydrogenase [Candidatus Marinamargulisbacteria bacterium SCGC AG-410-N11]
MNLNFLDSDIILKWHDIYNMYFPYAQAIVIVALTYFNVPFLIWSVFIGWTALVFLSPQVFIITLSVLVLLNIKLIRKVLISSIIMKTIISLKILPKISDTEKEAINAGTVWLDGEIFTGKPNLKKILEIKDSKLSKDEQEFLDGPVEELCEMVNDWDVNQTRDFEPKVWDFIKKKKFFGLIIPKEYGGLGFSALGNSSVIAKLSSRSSALAITCMVPNSLGPAELLIHYGTQEQKEYYLPRLAVGQEIPCFGLTEPNAGSDAGALSSKGEIFKNKEGKLYIRLSINKRWITLSAISTVIGLAFRLYDPNKLLGEKIDLGITCALIPSNTPGIELGNRHDPLGVPFVNSPVRGENVEIPLSYIIGEESGIGNGWRMLMECLAAGRGISLPATCTGGAKYLTRVVSAYASVRKQFGLPLGKFEGVEEPIARMATTSYILESARRLTCTGIDKGAKPAVLTAIAKYNFTEEFRTVVNDAMDVVAGSAISLGPTNLVAGSYFSSPISITVEGANILTRTLIIFGQGVLRGHPYVLKQVQAIEENNYKNFDRAIWEHIAHVISNTSRYIVLSLTKGLILFPLLLTKHGRYKQRIIWGSTIFAWLADIALFTLGGNLKRKEKLTGRYADILSWLYMAISVLKRYESEGSLKEDRVLFQNSMEVCFYNIQQALTGILTNLGFPFKILSLFHRLNPIGYQHVDKVGSQIASLIQKPGQQRDRLTEGVFQSKDLNDPYCELEEAFQLIDLSNESARKIKDAIRKQKISTKNPSEIIKKAIESNIITEKESQILMNAEALRRKVIQVDEFTPDQYFKKNKNKKVS